MQDNPTKLRFLLMIIIFALVIPTSVVVSGSQDQDLNGTIDNDGSLYITMTELIELDNGLPYVTHGEYGAEVRIDGIDMDPRSSYLRLPMITKQLDLPLGSRIIDITISDPEIVSLRIPMNLGINPHSIAKREDAVPLVPEGGRFEQTEYINFEMMTGIDPQSLETVAVLSMMISPVIYLEDHLSCLVKGIVSIEYEMPVYSSRAMDDVYDVLVICPDPFTDIASQYSDYRNATGLFTKVVTMTDILNDTYWTIQENDTQEEIKRFIYTARLIWGVDYVLLAGDQEHIPTRHIYVEDGYDDAGTQFTDGSYVPSDLYFSDLFDDGTTTFTTWNEDRVGSSLYKWGEWDGSSADDPDLYPDVFVGRLPASTVAEFQLMVDKIKDYELNSKGSDWYYNATLCGTNTFTYNPTPEGEYVCDYLETNLLGAFNVTKLFETTNTLFNISNVIDQGTGLVVYSDHGDYDGWGYTSVYPSGAYRSLAANGQDNGHMLPIVILDACLTSGFDNENASDSVSGKDPVLGQWYYPPGSSLSTRDCLAEYFHKSDDGGAIATFGCTRVGYGSPGSSYVMVNSGYMDVRLNKAISEGVKTTGQVLATAQGDYLSNIGLSSAASYKTVTEYVLLGDPSLNIGGITGTNVKIDLGENVTVPPGEEITINFTVGNIGIIPADVVLNATIIGNSRHVWSVNASVENATILPGENLTGTIDIYAPPMALATQTREVVLKVDSTLFPSERTGSITAFTLMTNGINVTMDPPELSAPQGSDAVGFINVENEGNGEETFAISFPDLREQWKVNMTSFTVEVGAYKTAGFPFKLTVPDTYLAGTYDVSVAVRSTITEAAAIGILRMTVESDRSFQFSVPYSIVELYPEENISVPFNIDASSNLEITLDMGWSGSRLDGWNIGLINGSIDLDPFSSGSGSLWIEAPNGTDPGVYSLTLTSDNGETTKDTLIDIVVLKKYAYEAVCECPVMEILPGDDLTFTINVTNLGNIFDQFNISVLDVPDDNWTATMNPDLFSVAKGRYKEVYLDISTVFPLNGTYTMRLLIEPWSYAGPQILELNVIVAKFFDFDLIGDFIDDKVIPGEEFVGDFILVNSGNSPDNFTLVTSVEAGWSTPQYSQPIVLDATGSMILDLDFLVPEDAMAGEYTFQMLVTNSGSIGTKSFTRTIFVKEVFDLRMDIGIDGFLLDLRPGRLYQFTVLIENFGNAPDSVTIGVSASSYVREWISLSTSSFTAIPPGENRTFEINLKVPKNITEGDYRLSLMVGSMGDIEAVRTNLTLHVEDKASNGILAKIDIVPIIIAGIAGLGIIIIVVFILVRAYKKSSGMDLGDAGMEWEEDEDEGSGKWDDDWE